MDINYDYCDQLNQNNVHLLIDWAVSALDHSQPDAIPEHLYYIVHLFIIYLGILELLLLNSLM